MKSVILITSNDKELIRIHQYWKDKATNIYFDNQKLNMIIYGERIYIDYLEDEDVCYEKNELSFINISKPIFYLICYSDREIMRRFIQENSFSENSFMDNDMGEIVLVDRLKEGEILKFIE